MHHVVKLQNYYARLSSITAHPNELSPWFCPSISVYHNNNNRLVEFKYQWPLENNPVYIMFLAETVEDLLKLVMVKFVQWYRKEVHEILAQENMASKLFYHGPIGVGKGDPSYGALHMVIMEYIIDTILHRVEASLLHMKDQIKMALKHLYNCGFVFGDLQSPNIIVIDQGKDVKLINFDWASNMGRVNIQLCCHLHSSGQTV